MINKKFAIRGIFFLQSVEYGVMLTTDSKKAGEKSESNKGDPKTKRL